MVDPMDLVSKPVLEPGPGMLGPRQSIGRIPGPLVSPSRRAFIRICFEKPGLGRASRCRNQGKMTRDEASVPCNGKSIGWVHAVGRLAM
jgi:hypothetical protein